MKTKIKEKVLKKIENLKILRRLFKQNQKVIFGNEEDIKGLENDFKRAVDLTLAEVGKVIDEEIKAEIRCLKTDEHDEQFVEHNNQIEMANKIKQKLGGLK